MAQGYLVNYSGSSAAYTVNFKDGTSLSGTLAAEGSTLVPPSGSAESWDDVTWVTLASGGGSIWMAGPSSDIPYPAELIAASSDATLEDVLARLGGGVPIRHGVART